MKRVKTKYGFVEGVEKERYVLFLGIPYAKPPIGRLRWHRPLPPEPWEGVLLADHFPCRSMQGDFGDPFFNKEFYDEPPYKTRFSEDSLYLNIWTPAVSSEEKLPVAFWIHGGAFIGGNGHEKEFDGAEYCRRGVILVTINYRLGPFGFLAHPWLSAESEAEGGPAVSGNYGILDQIAALEWVRENINEFGGDPENITVFGQSAGGMSTQTLLTSPLTQGMFAKAIIQSGVGLSRDYDLSAAEKLGLQFSANAGVESLEAMRALKPGRVLEAALPIIMAGSPDSLFPFVPLKDGYVLAEGYDEAVETGAVHAVPTIVGSTLNDIFTDRDALARGDRGPAFSGMIRWAEAQLRHGRPVWVYYFVRRLPGDDAGAFHSSELWYMFGTMDRSWRPWEKGDRLLSERMMDYWCSFMRSGDPNCEGLPFWKPYRRPGDQIVFDV